MDHAGGVEPELVAVAAQAVVLRTGIMCRRLARATTGSPPPVIREAYDVFHLPPLKRERSLTFHLGV